MAKQPLWNVQIAVLDLVPADSAEDAILRMATVLIAAGFEVCGEAEEGTAPNAFESEQLDDETDRRIRREWRDR